MLVNKDLVGAAQVSVSPAYVRPGERLDHVRAARLPSLDRLDAWRFCLAMKQASEAAGADVTHLSPDLGPFARAALRRSCRYAHSALLLFPTTVDAALGDFEARRLHAAEPVPSVLVRRRLCARYGLDYGECDVSLTRLRTSPAAGQNLEVFLFSRSAGALRPEIVNRERTFGYEDHVAFEVSRPDESTLERLMTLLEEDGGLIFEGGGHNPYEGCTGTTVLYFLGDTAGRWAGRARRFKRIELCCAGDFSAVVDRRHVDRAAVADAYARWADSAEPSDAPRRA